MKTNLGVEYPQLILDSPDLIDRRLLNWPFHPAPVASRAAVCSNSGQEVLSNWGSFVATLIQIALNLNFLVGKMHRFAPFRLQV